MAGTPKKRLRKELLAKPELIDEVCDKVIKGERFEDIAKSLNLWPRQLWEWLKGSQDRSEKYARAQEVLAQRLAEETLAIADDSSGDIYQNGSDKAGNPTYAVNNARVQRDKLRCDARRWHASKLNPEKWGERQEITLKVGTLEDALQTLKLPTGEQSQSPIIDLPAASDVQPGHAPSLADAEDELAALCGEVPKGPDKKR